MEKKTKIYGGKTNNTINIPTMWLDFLRATKGDDVTLKLDVKNSQIVIKFDKK